MREMNSQRSPNRRISVATRGKPIIFESLREITELGARSSRAHAFEQDSCPEAMRSRRARSQSLHSRLHVYRQNQLDLAKTNAVTIANNSFVTCSKQNPIDISPIGAGTVCQLKISFMAEDKSRVEIGDGRVFDDQVVSDISPYSHRLGVARKLSPQFRHNSHTSQYQSAGNGRLLRSLLNAIFIFSIAGAAPDYHSLLNLAKS